MPNSCCAVGCTNHGMMARKLSFFTFPKDLERQEKWVNAVKRINRDGSKWVPSKYTVLCSDHFIEGKPNLDCTHPDFIPSVFNHVKTTKKNQENKLKRFSSAVKRKIGFSTSTPNNKRQRHAFSPIQDNEEEIFTATPLGPIHNLSGLSKSVEVQEMQGLHEEIKNLRSEKIDLQNEKLDLQKKLDCAKLSVESVRDNDNRCKFYTGLTWSVFTGIFTFLVRFQKSSNVCRKVSFEEQFFMTLVKLRHDMPLEILADVRAVSVGSISNLFWTWVNLFHEKLDFLIKWPDRETIRVTLPGHFKSKFPRLTSIVDCFEIFIERPRNLKARAQCYSNYKKHSTIKVFIACSPNGAVTYISSVWGGRVSDVELVRSSGFISNKYHLPGDQILADRGFTLQDDFASTCSAQLLIPAFTKGKKQLSAEELETSRKISSVRIHIERVIGLIKQRFKILQGTLPIKLIQSVNDEADGNELSRIDKIIRCCAVLVNMGDGIVYSETD